MSAATNRPPPGGMPILSGPPPAVETSTCTQCSKEFQPLWRRPHTCGHCGYSFCSNCMGGAEALMPRKSGQASSSSNPFTQLRDELGLGKETVNGYEVSPVCIPCLGMLQVTAAQPSQLRSLPLKRLKGYIEAYNIQCVPLEKEDFVQAIIKSRNPQTGCLSPEAESYYRRKSAAKGSSGSSTPRQSTPNRARPPPNNARFTPPTRPPPPQARPPPSQHQHRPPPPNNYRPPPPTARPPPSRPTPARPAPPPAQAPPPIPTLYSLVSLPTSYLSSLTIGQLKAILYENHVRVDFSQVIEKGELVKRLSELVTEERKRLERQAREEQLEAEGTDGNKEPSPLPDATGQAKPVPTGPMPDLDRGRCVVCCDQEAVLANTDCGHLAMCAACADLIMATSQECPLCRQRILTKARLIRIYRA